MSTRKRKRKADSISIGLVGVPGECVAEEYNGIERRQGERRGVVDRRTGLGRRRGPGRRRSDLRRQAEEGEMTDELLEFVLAIDEYKRLNNRPFPSWSEVFEIIRYLGYRKVTARGEHIDRPAADAQGPAETESQAG